VLTVDAETEAGDSVHAAAWGVLTEFVLGLRVGGKGWLCLPSLPTRSNVGPLHPSNRIAFQPCLGCRTVDSPIRRGAGTATGVEARVCGARADLFPLTPQRSVPVEENVQANGLVFSAELRSALAHQMKCIRRSGFATIFEGDDGRAG
jgi:hypothetical protein